MMVALSILTMMAYGDCTGRSAQVDPVYPDHREEVPRDAVFRLDCRTQEGGCEEPRVVTLRRDDGDVVVPLTMVCHPAYGDDTHCTATPDQHLEEGELYVMEWSSPNYDGFGFRFDAGPCGAYDVPIPVLSEVRVGSATDDYCDGAYRLVSGQLDMPDAGDGATILRVYEGDELVYSTRGDENPTEFTYRIGTDKTEACLYGVLEAGDGSLSAPSALACGDVSGPTAAPPDAPTPTGPMAGPSRGECVNAPPTDTAAYEPAEPGSGESESTSTSESGCSHASVGRWLPSVFERRR